MMEPTTTITASGGNKQSPLYTGFTTKDNAPTITNDNSAATTIAKLRITTRDSKRPPLSPRPPSARLPILELQKQWSELNDNDDAVITRRRKRKIFQGLAETPPKKRKRLRLAGFWQWSPTASQKWAANSCTRFFYTNGIQNATIKDKSMKVMGRAGKS